MAVKRHCAPRIAQSLMPECPSIPFIQKHSGIKSLEGEGERSCPVAHRLQGHISKKLGYLDEICDLQLVNRQTKKKRQRQHFQGFRSSSLQPIIKERSNNVYLVLQVFLLKYKIRRFQIFLILTNWSRFASFQYYIFETSIFYKPNMSDLHH